MKLLPGSAFRLPLVGQVSTVRSHAARPISWHAHEGYELIFLLDGEMSYETRSAPAISIKGGSFCIFPPGVAHRGVNSIGTPSTLLGLECQPDRPDAASLTTLTHDNILQVRTLIESSVFSKVFRRYTGITPSRYRTRVSQK